MVRFGATEAGGSRPIRSPHAKRSTKAAAIFASVALCLSMLALELISSRRAALAPINFWVSTSSDACTHLIREVVMVEFLSSAVTAIPAAAASPFALAAYGLAILAFVVISWRVSRNKNLLHYLRRLPQETRFPALQTEMGNVLLKEGISPEQWLQSKIHRYYFIGFLFLIGAIAVVLVVVFAQIRGSYA
jgi:hypothetical protein